MSAPRAILAALLIAFAPIGLAHAKPPAVAAIAPRDAVHVQEVVSPGGVKAWLVSDSTVPLIVLNAYWQGGSASDPNGKEGAAGMMADMLTEGAGALDAEAFKIRLEELNMSLGFGAGWDGINMGLSTLSKNRDAAFEMAAMTLMEPRFDAAPLARLKRQAQIGIKQRETNPGYIANLALDGAIIPGHPYAARSSMDSITAIGREDLAERKTALMTRDHMMITVAGDIDAATLGPLLDKTFGALPASGEAVITPDIEPKAGQGVIVKTLPQPQSLLLFAAPGIQDEDPDWIPLVVANYILGGGGFSSRLMDEVREKRGLVYGIGTGPRVYDHAAFLRGSAQTENGDVAQSISVIKAEIARLHDQGATQDEVDDAKRYLTGSFALSLDSNQKIAGALQGFQVAGRDINYVNARNALIEAVTKEDVDRVARRLFDPGAFTFVVVGMPEGLE